MSEENIKKLKENISSPIVLIGMMGAGKSHVGRKLAHELQYDFYDSDTCVEEEAGCTIAEIFERYGEEKFREAEKNIILSLLRKDLCVISTGGGAFINEETRTAIKEKALSIWLNPDTELLYERLKDKTDRPLLQEGDLQETINTLLGERRAFYQEADITLSISNENEGKVLEILIKSLSER